MTPEEKLLRAIEVTPSSGCIFCDIGLKPVKMKRQWIHHIPEEGRNIICPLEGIKPYGPIA